MNKHTPSVAAKYNRQNRTEMRETHLRCSVEMREGRRGRRAQGGLFVVGGWGIERKGRRLGGWGEGGEGGREGWVHYPLEGGRGGLPRGQKAPAADGGRGHGLGLSL